MKTYAIVFCFLDKNGYIEQNEKGEIIYTQIIGADNEREAMKCFYGIEHFIENPEILSIKEVKIK